MASIAVRRGLRRQFVWVHNDLPFAAFPLVIRPHRPGCVVHARGAAVYRRHPRHAQLLRQFLPGQVTERTQQFALGR